MKWTAICAVLFFSCWQTFAFPSTDLATLKRDQKFADFRVDHLYSDSEGKVIGVKFVHIPTGAPVFLLQMETVPQLFTWVDSPADSNQGLPHAMEHLLILKGAKGRYLNLLEGMRLSDGGAATSRDYVYYGLSSGSGVDGFFEQFHVLLDALYRPDFTDTEAEREFYHFAVANDGGKKKTLIESGTVYNEMLSSQDRYKYIFELSKRVLGEQSPFAFDSGGVPDEMRGVAPEEIRRFHNKYYRIGPGTGFIFSFSPQESVPDLLKRISQEFRQFSEPGAAPRRSADGEPKYPIHPSDKLEPGIYPFPGPNEAAPGVVHFSWAPTRSDALVDLKMLELLIHALAGGEDSLLHKAVVDSKTRVVDLGATGIDYELSFEYSPFFPLVVLEISGVPGNRISTENLERLRSVVLSKIKEVSQYPDQSGTLGEFNRSVMAYAKSLRRSDSVWIKNPPGFGSYPPKTTWKGYLESLETESSFVRSLSAESEWQEIDQGLGSGRNVWRDLIRKLHLLDTPYVTATAPSPKLLEETENRKQDRVKSKIRDLMDRYHLSDEQEALSRFEREEVIKTKEIDAIDTKVPRPHFTDHPPMIPDEDLRYSQFEIEGVPVIANIFNRPPTIDIGLSFDMRRVPQRYYRYLPILPDCLDSLGLKIGDQIVTYSELVSKIQRDVFAFSTGYETNPVSKRADFTIRASATNAREFRDALNLIHQLTESNYLDPSNADRLRDIVARRISTGNSYAKQDTSTSNAGYSLRYQNDPLYLALNSRFTGAHFDNRLQWLLRAPVNPAEVNKLDSFAKEVLSSTAAMSRKDLAQKLDGLNITGLEKELVEYWRMNFSSFSETGLAGGLRKLAAEVVEDLRTGPTKAIEDLRTLQRIVLNRRALRLDLTLSERTLGDVRGDLESFVKSMPTRSFENDSALHNADAPPALVMAGVEKRYHLSQGNWPGYVGFVNPNRTGGDVMFFADFPDYSQLDRKSLIRVLATKLFEGAGPQSFQMRTLARGLTYHNAIYASPASKRIWYYADRSPDIPSLLGFVNEMASSASELTDSTLVDYAFSNTFTFSRGALTFTERGKVAAQDIRDGNEPEKVRRFSEAILKLRKEPNLLSELTRDGLPAICGVLLMNECKEQHQTERSLFVFVGSEQVLSDVEKRLSIPNLLNLYPSDFWFDFPGNSGRADPTTSK
jgi:Zn-dependent M16 (insulinase) family peptidase